MSNLPKLADLYNDVEVTKKADQLTVLLNQNPKVEWVKTHPFIKGYRYLPIERVEFLLKSIFKKYRIEILREGTAFNGVYVVVRVHYLNPVTNEMDWHDGIGAMQLQTAKGTSAADLANINNGALAMAFPAAKTVAIKDACDHFGKLFGSDLNRKEQIAYKLDSSLVEFTPEHESWQKAIEALKDGTVTIEAIEKAYNLSPENKELLCKSLN